MKRVLIVPLLATLLFGHNELERIEEHLFTKFFMVDFVNSTMKKGGYGAQLKYGNKQGSHNIVFDHKYVHIRTTPKVPKNLLVRKYAVGYQYLSRVRTIVNFLYICDSLVEEADDVRVFGAGVGYKNMELKLYYKKFRRFDSLQADLRWY